MGRGTGAKVPCPRRQRGTSSRLSHQATENPSNTDTKRLLKMILSKGSWRSQKLAQVWTSFKVRFIRWNKEASCEQIFLNLSFSMIKTLCIRQWAAQTSSPRVQWRPALLSLMQISATERPLAGGCAPSPMREARQESPCWPRALVSPQTTASLQKWPYHAVKHSQKQGTQAWKPLQVGSGRGGA